MKYDDASWHYSGDFPADLPVEAGATHIAMFVAWAKINGMDSVENGDDAGDMLAALRDRRLTPGRWFIQACDGKFVDADLNEEGNAFARRYYVAPEGSNAAQYLDDYSATFDSAENLDHVETLEQFEAFDHLESLYHVVDSWENYNRLAPIITMRFTEWQNSQSPDR